MGGSSSKKEKSEKNKENEIGNLETNENKNIQSAIKNNEKENNLNINIPDNNNIKDEIKNENKNIDEELLDGIEELTLDKNGILTRNYNNINSTMNQALTFELLNSQTELNKNEDNKTSLNNNDEHIKIEKKDPIIIYTEIATQELIINFYEKMIDVTNSFSFRKNFISSVKSLNESFLYNLNVNKFPQTKEIDDFLYSFKYSAIIIACLVFLTKDYDLFNNTKKKIKEFLEQFIYTCLDLTNKDIILSLKILNFYNSSKKMKKTLFNCVNQIIRILFKSRESYKNILNCLEQLFSKINTESTQSIIDKINNTILFYYNATTYNNENNKNSNNTFNNNIIITKRRKSMVKKSKISLKNHSSFNTAKVLYRSESYYKGLNQRNYKIKIRTDSNSLSITKNESKENKNAITPPFIKEEMPKSKKFCLVLDIDETISHLVKLPFGNYFLIRPGVKELLEELHKYYEIDIFTAALQNYADNILDKLDQKNIYFSHRLYRCHCSWEEGKSIKKLDLIGRDLNKIVFVDDIERNAKYNMKNLILVSKWSDNIFDDEIINIKNKLKIIAEEGKYDEDITVGLLNEKLSNINSMDIRDDINNKINEKENNG